MYQRLIHIISTGGRSFLPSLINLVVSALVVRSQSIDLWGEFVALTVSINLFVQVINWGHREPLIRSFTTSPNSISTNWFTSLWTRLCIIIIPLIYFLINTDDSTILVFILITLLLQSIVQSFETLIIFKQQFKTALMIDLIGGLLFGGWILIHTATLGIETLFLGLIIQFVFKAFAYLIITKNLLTKFSIKFSSTIIKENGVFFLIGLASFLNARIAILVVQYFSSKEVIGTFHVISIFLLQSKAIAAVLLIPISKYMYKLNRKSYTKLLKKMLLIGSITSLVLAIIIPIAIHLIYRIELTSSLLPALVIYILTGFIEVPIIYWLYKNKREKLVLTISYIGVVLHITLMMIFSNDLNIKSLIYVITSIKLIIASLFLFVYTKKSYVY